MSKNFTETENRRYKSPGFMCPSLSFVSASLVKNCGLEPFLMFLLSTSVPHGVSSFLNYVNVYYQSR